MVAYRVTASYLAWKCLKSLCGGGGGGWWVLKVNLVIGFGLSQAEQFIGFKFLSYNTITMVLHPKRFCIPRDFAFVFTQPVKGSFPSLRFFLLADIIYVCMLEIVLKCELYCLNCSFKCIFEFVEI